MVYIPQQLNDAAVQAAEGKQTTVSVRTLLLWFGAERRGARVVEGIRQALKQVQLVTKPNFEFAYIDAPISLTPAEPSSEAPSHAKAAEGQPNIEPQELPQLLGSEEPAAPSDDPTYRIGKLAAANRVPQRVSPDMPLDAAVTLMLAHDYSQLPVMTSDREVKGLISWRAIAARLALHRECTHVRDAMERHHEVSEDDSLFTAIRLIAEHEAVLVRAKDRRITGLVTTADLALTFDQLGEPFLVLGEIENHIRSILNSRLSVSDLSEAKDPADVDREVNSAADLSFGEYVRLLENPEKWFKLDLHINQPTLVREVQAVRLIRNGAMHFDPDGMGEADLATLRRVAKFLRTLREVGVTS